MSRRTAEGDPAVSFGYGNIPFKGARLSLSYSMCWPPGAEFERELIDERVRAGKLRDAGASWTEVAVRVGAPRTVCHRSLV